MKYLHCALCILAGIIIALPGRADDSTDIATPASTQILNIANDDTPCATAAFADALRQTAESVSESDHETVIQEWIYKTFSAPDVIKNVLACPEIASAADDQSIHFIPIEYTFPGGRRVVINYETQPKILKQRLTVATRRHTPGEPGPRISATGEDIWTNTDPAWYGIMVVESGSLDEFVGADKNNTISLQYIKDNIDRLYPQGWTCTSKSAKATDNDVINRAVTKTVNIEDDTNDYYVAGDVNLQWLSYAEVALDVVITVATFGTGTAIAGSAKAARASRTLKNLTDTIRSLGKLDSVRDYVRLSQRYARATSELKNMDRAADAAKYASKEQEIKRLADSMHRMEQADDNVRQYKRATESFAEINKLRHGLRAVHSAQRGNIAARAWRAFRATNTGNKTLGQGARIARSSMKSGRIRDWLFQSTLKNIGILGRMEAAGGLLYGTLKFVGDMYDWTETSTGDFTSGVDFSPLLLLSADDLNGQENVVNHGMWLMWAGDSVSAADDDAAYLQALDFAEKVYQDINETQISDNSYPCNIDIYVVRPVLRNPGGDNPEIYYLIMNDTPWRTARGDNGPGGQQ